MTKIASSATMELHPDGRHRPATNQGLLRCVVRDVCMTGADEAGLGQGLGMGLAFDRVSVDVGNQLWALWGELRQRAY